MSDLKHDSSLSLEGQSVWIRGCDLVPVLITEWWIYTRPTKIDTFMSDFVDIVDERFDLNKEVCGYNSSNRK